MVLWSFYRLPFAGQAFIMVSWMDLYLLYRPIGLALQEGFVRFGVAAVGGVGAGGIAKNRRDYHYTLDIVPFP